MANTLVYLDYAATTPIDELVFKEMAECMMMSGDFGNPASRSHILVGRQNKGVEAARKKWRTQ